MGLQLPRIPDDLEGPVLVTLTAGGNDLLHLLEAGPPSKDGPVVGGGPVDADDVADGTGELPSGEVVEGGLEMLHEFNDRVRVVGGRDGVRVADIHDHFLGHGLEEPDPAEHWYWRYSIIEPSAREASDVRRLFQEAIDG